MAVASKPHYFCELRVVPSVRALLRHVSHFWRSDELAASLATGDFLALDYGHWGRVGGTAGMQGITSHHMATSRASGAVLPGPASSDVSARCAAGASAAAE